MNVGTWSAARFDAVLEAVGEARRRAMARGLTETEIDREQDDVDSQYWEDVAEIAAAQRARRATH